jgi:hypothetical protein
MIQLQQAKGKFDKLLLKNGDWYAEEEVQGIRGIVACTPAGFFINETFLTLNDENELLGVRLDGVLEPDGTLTLFDCLGFRGQRVADQPLIRRRRVLGEVLNIWGWEKARMVPNGALLGLTNAEMIARGPVILKNLRAPYGDEQAWVKVNP